MNELIEKFENKRDRRVQREGEKKEKSSALLFFNRTFIYKIMNIYFQRKKMYKLYHLHTPLAFLLRSRRAININYYFCSVV